jgi:hypothetical protein
VRKYLKKKNNIRKDLFLLMVSEVSVYQSREGVAKQSNSHHGGEREREREREREYLC